VLDNDDGINGDDVPSKNGRSGIGATLLSPVNGLSGVRGVEASDGELNDTRGVTVEASIIGRRPREGTENDVVAIVGVVSSSKSVSSRNEGSLKLPSGRTLLVGPARPKFTIQ
jgi:hypothetical protein